MNAFLFINVHATIYQNSEIKILNKINFAQYEQ